MHRRSVLLSVALHVAVIVPFLLAGRRLPTREPPRIAVLSRRETPRPLAADENEPHPAEVRAEDPREVPDMLEPEILRPPSELEPPPPAPPGEAPPEHLHEPPPNVWYARVRPPPRRAPPAASHPAAPARPRVLEATPLEGHAPPPRYPERAIRLGQQGEVLVRLHVDATGRVVRVEVVRACPYRLLVAAVLRAVRTWRFRPATRDGRPVPAVVERRFVFRIRPAARTRR